MKKSTLLAGIGLALSLAVAGSASAGTPRLDARQHHQRERIDNGVANGELTRRETRRLAAGQVHLKRVEASRQVRWSRDRRASVLTCSTKRTSSRVASIARSTTPRIATERRTDRIEGHVSHGTCPFHIHGPGVAGIESRAQPVTMYPARRMMRLCALAGLARLRRASPRPTRFRRSLRSSPVGSNIPPACWR